MPTTDPVSPGASVRAAMPTITVVVVNLDGRDLLGPCLDSLADQTYDPELVEVVLIDNASTDGSVQLVRERYPHVRVIVNDVNVGFSPAINQAAEVANGELLALLNNDAQADPDWLTAAAAYLVGHEEVGCVASLIRREDGTTLDYAGSAMGFNGMGYAVGHGQPATSAPRAGGRTLFASGGAMITPTRLFLDSGGFDESYFAFFEDVDYGWRLWVMGHETHLVPTSTVRHRHHGTIKRFGYARERYLLERNALATIFKNYGDDVLARTLPASVLLTLMRGLSDLGDRDGLPDYAITPGAPDIDATDVTIPAVAGAHLAAMRDFGRAIGDLGAKRRAVQARRRTGDEAILPLLREPLRPNVAGREYSEVFDAVVEVFELEDLAEPSHVLIVTEDKLGERMAGPAIRAYEMATVLTEAGFDVTLGSLKPIEIAGRGFDLVDVSMPGVLTAVLTEVDIVVFQGFVMHHLPEIRSFDGPVVVDLYDPFHLEGMNLHKHALDHVRYSIHNSDVGVLNDQLTRGDFFVCASEKQRDLWIGQLAGLKRVNPATFDEDESLRSLIDVAPFGLPGGPPVRTEDRVLRGVVPGIEDDDFLLIWGGGIYNWFDPLTLIRAVGEVVREDPAVKLFFMGSAHPSVPRMAMAATAHRLADDLGLLDTHVHFNEGWIDYASRQNYLLEADVGVSTHFEHLETRYSFRTRILDYVWCELPIISTSGDTLSALAVERGLGLAVPPEDVAACADAIRRLRTDAELYERCRDNLRAIKPEMTWHRALQPVVEFCRTPRRAADVSGRRRRYLDDDVRLGDVVVDQRPDYYARRFLRTAVSDGPMTALRHARNIVRHRLHR